MKPCLLTPNCRLEASQAWFSERKQFNCRAIQRRLGVGGGGVWMTFSSRIYFWYSRSHSFILDCLQPETQSCDTEFVLWPCAIRGKTTCESSCANLRLQVLLWCNKTQCLSGSDWREEDLGVGSEILQGKIHLFRIRTGPSGAEDSRLLKSAGTSWRNSSYFT